MQNELVTVLGLEYYFSFFPVVEGSSFYCCLPGASWRFSTACMQPLRWSEPRDFFANFASLEISFPFLANFVFGPASVHRRD